MPMRKPHPPITCPHCHREFEPQMPQPPMGGQPGGPDIMPGGHDNRPLMPPRDGMFGRPEEGGRPPMPPQIVCPHCGQMIDVPEHPHKKHAPVAAAGHRPAPKAAPHKGPAPTAAAPHHGPGAPDRPAGGAPKASGAPKAGGAPKSDGAPKSGGRSGGRSGGPKR